jgi:hypothetical protein
MSKYDCIGLEECRERTVDHSLDGECEVLRFIGGMSFVFSGLIVGVPAIIGSYVVVREKVLAKIVARRTAQMFY